jgi:hypothetical protein
MSWGKALMWGTVIVAVLHGVIAAAYFLIQISDDPVGAAAVRQCARCSEHVCTDRTEPTHARAALLSERPLAVWSVRTGLRVKSPARCCRCA